MNTKNISRAITLLKALTVNDKNDAMFKIAELAREELDIIESSFSLGTVEVDSIIFDDEPKNYDSDYASWLEDIGDE